MTSPNQTTNELITQLCQSREGALQGLPDGCMPGSMCAAAQLYPYAFFLVLLSGLLVGIAIARTWKSH